MTVSTTPHVTLDRTVLALVVSLLRSPKRVIEAASDADELAWVVPRLLLVTVIGAAVFGGVVGAYRGGIQVLYAAIKMPFLLTLPLIVVVPAVRALFGSPNDSLDWTRVGLAGLVAVARTTLLAAAASPLLWLAWSVVTDYHAAALLLAISLMAIGVQGAWVLRHALPRLTVRHVGALVIAASVMGITTAQTGWLLRPFIARPTAEVTFLRPIEADIASAIVHTTRSAAGDYGSSWDAEREGLTRGFRRGE